MCVEKTFDELVELLQDNPAGFEKYKEEFINSRIAEMCADCPEHLERCKRFQWRLDQELAKHKNPIMRYNAMVEIFWKGVEEFQHKLINKKQPEPTTKASVLPFSKKD